jgi:hypothetical protein
MKRRRFRTIRATVVLMVIAGVAILIAPSASASAPTATASLTGSVGAGGTAGSFTFSITPSSRTLAAYTVTAPAGWQISSVASPSPSGTASISGRTISVTGTSVSGSAFGTVQFMATACAAQSYTWSYTATDSQGRAYAHPSTLTASVAGPSCSLELLNQPTDTTQNDQITANPFDAGVQNLQVQLLNGNGAALTTYGVVVTFGLATGFDQNGQQLVSGTLTVDSETTDVNGVATFVDRLSIAQKNEPQFTSYSLEPSTTASLGDQAAPTITGTQSNGFDIWETQCPGNGCQVSIRGQNHNLDLYTSPTGTGDLSASELPAGDLANLTCQGQIPVFANSVFASEFTGSGAVFLKSHVTRADMKASANNGQAHVQWCIGLETTAPWVNNGGSFVHEDTNGDGTNDLYVGLAPACPNANPQNFAPCITRQYGDGNGGSYTEGYVPGDPPRRT